MCCVPEGGEEHQSHFSADRMQVSSVELCANPLQTQPQSGKSCGSVDSMSRPRVAQLMRLVFSSGLTNHGTGAVGISNR